jgi:hypothetical protein
MGRDSHALYSSVLACALVCGTVAAACGGSDAGGLRDRGAGATGDGAPGSPSASAPGDGSGGAGGTATNPSAGSAPPGACSTVDGIDRLPTGAAQLKILCARNNGDVVSKAFCSGPAPTITSLVALESLVGLAFLPGQTANANGGVPGGNPATAFNAHSSSLVKRLTSAINPRVILMTANGEGQVATPVPNPKFVSLAFVRGEEFVELAANDPTARGGKGDLRFYLFKFDHACSTSAAGCTPADLFTPAIESGFTSYTLYQDVDLSNTPLDCQQCHQPGGPGTSGLIRFPELKTPWTHYFGFGGSPGGQALLADFVAAHGSSEAYGGVPGALIPNMRPAYTEGAVENQGGKVQPNEFLSATIEAEVLASSPAQPAMNVPAGTSATWQGIYNKALAGNDIPVPYHDVKITDPTKLAAMTKAYSDVRLGKAPPSSLPNVSDVILDAALTGMGIRPAAGLDGHGILVQTCTQCHNSRLDQTLSRARFNVDTLAQMSAAEKAEAIRRINLPDTDCEHMPPKRFKELSAAEIQLAAQELSK